MTETLLPPSATPQERAADAVCARIGDADEGDVVATLWDPDRCPSHLLEQLRWALDAPGHWPADDAGRRAALRGAVRVHKRRGTRGALDRALIDAGVVARIVERPNGRNHVVSVLVLNSGALDAGIDTAAEVQALAERTGRASVRYDVSLAADASLRLGRAATVESVSLVLLEVAA